MTMSSRSIAVAASWALPRRAGLALLKQTPLARRSLASGPHFDGFFGGGFPGQGGPPPGVDTEKFYKLLGTDKNASESDIKSAYKKQAMKHHPDRGGDEATFKEISKAYEVLSNPQKRQIYDTYGEQGLEGADQGGGGGAPSGMDPFDLFSQMFGFQAQGGRQGRRGKPVTPDSHYELQMSLEELYTGTSRSIKFTRDAICGSCHGQGGKNPKMCQRCNGTGVVVQLQQMGPFMRQSQSPCSACNGKGQIIKPQDICQTCTGKGTVKETKTFYIEVEPGQENGTEIRFAGAADEAPGHDTGDVVIAIKEKSHKAFQRVKESLVMSKKITLVEALCGFQFTTKFLDGEDLIIRSTPGQVCRPGDMLIVKGKGMPRKNSRQAGDLFLQLKVEFPDEVPEASRGALAELLGGKLPPDENLIESSSAKKLTQRQIEDIHQRWSHAARQQEQTSQQCAQQ